MNTPHRTDVHHHIVPPEYVRALEGQGITNAIGAPFPAWDPETTLAVMDRNGIQTAVTSISAPGVFFGDVDFARTLARRCNEISARLVTDYPGRFGAFATLPLPDAEASLTELAYAADTLKLDGVVLLTNYAGRYLGGPVFEPVFAELNPLADAGVRSPCRPPGRQRPGAACPQLPL